jgi:aspartate ammonia-lyase
MVGFRTEHDLMGTREIPAEALYGIHTQRALDNFPLSGRTVHPALIHGFGAVKLACARTNRSLGWLPTELADALDAACREMMAGDLDGHIVVDALQGGAGTSTNMNVNEVLANRAIQLLGGQPGQYQRVSPVDHVNLHQSTNDTYPTALRVAAIRLLGKLEQETVALQESFQSREHDMAHVVKVGRTQLQDAVLTTLGRTMSAYAEALNRDRWRVFKCVERLRVVNLGGTAIGTGLLAPRQYIFRVVDVLREITGQGLARAENLVEATQNTDAFVEVSGILKALASNLVKIGNDLRLMSSGPDAGLGELLLPARQAGSSIMPGKVNPVIPEAVVQAGLKVMANDQALTQACSMGNLELNAFLPLIADCLLDSITLLTAACHILRTRCVDGLRADEDRCRKHVANSTAAVTALVEVVGYDRAQDLARLARDSGRTVEEVVVTEGVLTKQDWDELVSPERVTRLGGPACRQHPED